MIYEIINYGTVRANPTFSRFEEALRDKNLSYNASNIIEITGKDVSQDMSEAINKAIKVCMNSGIPVEEHFRKYFISDDNMHTLSPDWKLSKFAYTLVLLNKAPDHPYVSQLQAQMIKEFIDRH
ncbi:hypothetical protein OO013_09980 [Mangrovivirga sp. M17]|uniref:Uncharacterized protein n=1 Tax=Mangrovivirga halotolerans TaxID=2993936 RepID=A0ABT3RRF7_9BACT|nr:hypothetical protein [Mangrovivirga halotolerans]MCX2744195.1 hypothetical protein [Mangrovivirga halotolerans]